MALVFTTLAIFSFTPASPHLIFSEFKRSKN